MARFFERRHRGSMYRPPRHLWPRLLLLSLAVVSLSAVPQWALDPLDYRFLDILLLVSRTVAPERFAPAPTIVFIAIDDEFLQDHEDRYHHWRTPWYRWRLAELLNRMHEQQPDLSAVGIDQVLFPLPDVEGAQANAVLAKAIRALGNVVVCSLDGTKANGESHTSQPPTQVAPEIGAAAAMVAHVGVSSTQRLSVHVHSLKQVQLVVSNPEFKVFLPLAMFWIAQEAGPRSGPSNFEEIRKRFAGNAFIDSASPEGEALLPYASPTPDPGLSSQIFITFKASDVLAGQAQVPRGAYILVGSGLQGVDEHDTPFDAVLGREMKGPEILLHVLNALVQAQGPEAWHWRLQPLPESLNWLILAVAAFMLALLSWRLGALRLLFLNLAVVAAVLLAAVALLTLKGLWLTPVHWISTLLITSFAAAKYTGNIEKKQRALFYELLHCCTPPAVLHRMIHVPQSRALGAQEERELTVLFSDMAGFSALSQTINREFGPLTMAAVLNSYMEGITAEIIAEGGTLGNYIGDAVFAIFGAPDLQPDHAARAARAAVRIQQRARQFADEAGKVAPELAGSPLMPRLHEVQTRIGLSTGRAAFGNIGSSARHNFTVVGDIVNLGQRVEAANKEYGSQILCTRQTAEALGQYFQCEAALPPVVLKDFGQMELFILRGEIPEPREVSA